MGWISDFLTNPIGAISDAVTSVLEPIGKTIEDAVSGLFVSTHKTSVGTTITRVIKDDVITSSIKVGLVNGLFKDEGTQLVENVMESLVAGIGIRAERMYSYAKDNYTHGLPVAKVSTSIDGSEVVLGVLKSLTNPGITVDYYHVGPMNNLHAAWWILAGQMGYDSLTNKIGGLSEYKDFDVYLKDVVLVIREATLAERANGSLSQWGTAANAGYTPERPLSNISAYAKPTPFIVDGSVSMDYARVTYVWEVPTEVEVSPAITGLVEGVTTVIVPASIVTRQVIHEESIDIPLAAFDLSRDFIHIKYYDAGKAGYWLYQWGSGIHPTIDALHGVTQGAPAEFFPVVYFRNAATNQSDSSGFASANRMLKTLGINYQEMIDAVHENPDIGKIEQAKLIFAVPANTTNPIEQRYLFDFFNKLRLASAGVTQDVWDVAAIDPNNELVSQGKVPTSFTEFTISKTDLINANSRIALSIEDKLSSTGLSCQGIFKRTRSGVIAAVDAYTSSFVTEYTSYAYTHNDTPLTLDAPQDVFIYSHQITEHVYEEIVVYDLKMTYHVFGEYYSVGDNLDAILLVPLDHAITETYSIPNRELLYTRSLHFVFSSKTVTEVKWYQQSWVGDLIKVVGVILTVMALGSDNGLFAATVSYLAGYTTLATLITTILITVAVAIAIVEVSKVFVRALGQEAAFIASILLTLYVVGKQTNSPNSSGLPWAEELLALSNGLSVEVSNTMTKAMNGLQAEADAFNLFVKEKTDLLEKEQKLLEYRSPILSPKIIFGQTPTEFYNMTIHAGNIGMVGIDSIHSYVDTALTLPKFNDTIGNNRYA